MQFFIKMQCEWVWNSVEYGWGPPLKLDINGNSTSELKPKNEWDRCENEANEANARAIFSIFNGVSPDEFKRIANYTRAKDAWEILKVTHEGTSIVKVPL